MTLGGSALARLLAVVLTVLSAVAVTAPAVAQTTTLESYVALGDSFTAGPGILVQRLDPLGCFRSDHNYPQLVARARGSALRDVSCSGASTGDLFSPQAVLGGPNPPQLAALDAGVDVVTVQVGGNDVGFTEILVRCAALLPAGTPCQDAYVRGGVDELGRRIAATAPKVAAALAEIRRRAPDARVLVVGYPAILPEAQPGCWPVLPVAPGDVPYLRDIEKRLNAMLAAQAAAAGATYVDVYAPSIGHDACQLPGARWVEPMVPLSPAAPVHPNALGMQAMAAVVAAAMPG
ncbi:MAG TPA: SGNH/GDSL hydrolase family protein [Acidimicrobiales bacterium]|nr:SGNH/GDSL hydrolase family protein [Acidimicrobiales bacterium]